MSRFPARKTDEPARLLTVAEVALLDSVSQKTVRRAIAAGLLEVVRVGLTGRSVRIEPAALLAYRRTCRE
jgi:excisionase family DNA binding protein